MHLRKSCALLSAELRGIAAFSLLLLSACGVYAPPYISRTILRGDANTDDFKWKKKSTIPRSVSPRPLQWKDQTQRVQTAFSAVAGGLALEPFLVQSRTQSLLVLHKDTAIYQWYADGNDARTPQAVFSASKSVLSLVIGHALHEKKLSDLADPVTTLLPELARRDSRFSAISLGHLLDMRSGIAYSSKLRFPFLNNDAPLVYYASDLRKVALTKTRITAAPGEFRYNDYNPLLVGLALERAVGAEGVTSLVNGLWSRLGAEDDAFWTVDGHSFRSWESGLVASTRDLAKVAAAITDPGRFPDVLAPGWQEMITAYAPTSAPAAFDGRQWGYNKGWWLILRPDGAHDIAAIGRFGQMLYASPSRGFAFVRTGHDGGTLSDRTLTSHFYALASALATRK